MTREKIKLSCRFSTGSALADNCSPTMRTISIFRTTLRCSEVINTNSWRNNPMERITLYNVTLVTGIA